MLSTSFPASLDTFIEVPGGAGNLMAENIIDDDHMNLIASAIPAIELRAKNVVMTNIPLWNDGNILHRRNIIMDCIDVPVTPLSVPPSATPSFRSIDTSVTVVDSNGNKVPVWNDTDWAVILRAKVKYYSSLNSASYQWLQSDVSILGISADGKTADVRVATMTGAAGLRLEILAVDKSASNITRGVNFDKWTLDPEVHPSKPIYEWFYPPYSPVLYMSSTYSSSYGATGYATSAYVPVGECSTDSRTGLFYWRIAPGKCVEYPDWSLTDNRSIAPSSLTTTGDFGWSYPDYASPLSQLIDISSESNRNADMVWRIQFSYKMRYPSKATDYRWKTSMRVYLHGYNFAGTLTSGSAATSGTCWKQMKPVWQYVDASTTKPYYTSTPFEFNSNFKWSDFVLDITVPGGDFSPNLTYLRPTIVLVTTDPALRGVIPRSINANWCDQTRLEIDDVRFWRIS